MCSLHPEVGITVGDREGVREASDDRASTEVVGLISLGKWGHLCLPGRSCFRLTRLITGMHSEEDVLNPTASKHRSHKYVNRSGSTLYVPVSTYDGRDKGLCCAIKGFMHSIAFRLHVEEICHV